MSNRKLVKIVTVDNISPIEGADRIEIAHIGGWQCIVKRGEFSPGSHGLFYEIDSFLPASDDRYAFLKPRGTRMLNGQEGMRIKTMKLRGSLSQGLLLPLDQFTSDELDAEDLAAALGVIKWDPPVPAQLRGQIRRYIPGFIHKTDQERVQNLVKEIEAHRGEIFEVTIKLDGSSMTVYHHDGETGVCSRNMELKVNDDNADNTFIKVAREGGLFAALATGDYGNIAAQGELIGPGIQGNREGLKEHRLFIFDVWDIDEQRYLRADERWKMFVNHLELEAAFRHVPVVDAQFKLDHTVDELLAMADGPSLNHAVREGLVFKSLDSDFTFKVISNKFLLKEEN